MIHSVDAKSLVQKKDQSSEKIQETAKQLKVVFGLKRDPAREGFHNTFMKNVAKHMRTSYVDQRAPPNGLIFSRGRRLGKTMGQMKREPTPARYIKSKHLKKDQKKAKKRALKNKQRYEMKRR